MDDRRKDKLIFISALVMMVMLYFVVITLIVGLFKSPSIYWKIVAILISVVTVKGTIKFFKD